MFSTSSLKAEVHELFIRWSRCVLFMFRFIETCQPYKNSCQYGRNFSCVVIERVSLLRCEPKINIYSSIKKTKNKKHGCLSHVAFYKKEEQNGLFDDILDLKLFFELHVLTKLEYVCVCMYICICTYMQTHIHIHSMFSSVQFSRSILSDSLRLHELWLARPPCPSQTPGVHTNTCSSSR